MKSNHSTDADQKHPEDIQRMFASISSRYDVMNRLMTFGQDQHWRKDVIRHANIPQKGRVLDLGCGTGDLAREATKQNPDSQTICMDFTLEMMCMGRRSSAFNNLDWCNADALSIPLPANSVDSVVSGFLLRNVSNIQQALAEQFRVLKHNGNIAVLDTTRPTPNLFTPLISLYLQQVIPTMGKLIAGNSVAYTYLPQSTQKFLTAEQLAYELAKAGFNEVGFKRLMLGTISIHWGKKPWKN
jgi:demethylmenaquinone methyltransferase/2-methoxy-6-polyprenyl-1,4-benzoquinol methylase